MNLFLKRALIGGLLLTMPVICLAAEDAPNHFNTYARIIAIVNVVLYITSVISIKQYFFLGDTNQTNFQRFNLIFGIVFLFIALIFLVNEKSFYPGFEQLSTGACIKKFFFGMGIYSALECMVLVALVINVIYIARYHDA